MITALWIGLIVFIVWMLMNIDKLIDILKTFFKEPRIFFKGVLFLSAYLTLFSLVASYAGKPQYYEALSPYIEITTMSSLLLFMFTILHERNVKRQQQGELHSKKQQMTTRIEGFHELEKAIFREFLIEQGPIVQIETADPFVDKLLDEQLITLVGQTAHPPYIFQVSPLLAEVLCVKHLFNDSDFQRMRIPREHREWLLCKAIGKLHFDGNAWQYLLSLRHRSKRPPQHTTN